MIPSHSHSLSETIAHITSARHLAVVGVSDKKMGGAIYKELKKHGYAVSPVHPTRAEFMGDRCYSSLTALVSELAQQHPDLKPADCVAVIAVKPEAAAKVVDDAATAGITHLWFQQGADFSRAIAIAQSKGIETVNKKCILMYAQPVKGVHAVHRFVARLFGKV